MKNNVLIMAIVALIVGAGSFYGGVAYQKSQTPDTPWGNGQFGVQTGQSSGGAQGDISGRFPGQGQGRPVSGEIIKKDDTGVTIKLQDGSTKIVTLSKDTKINKSVDGSDADLKQGERIMAVGSEGSDGNFTADNIQLGRFGVGFGFGRRQQGQ